MRHQPEPVCCRCCDQADRARATLATVLERGEDPSDWWCSHPENVCHCPSRPRAERCDCRHCLSWLRRAPRCRRKDCTAYQWVAGDELCHDHHSDRAAARSKASKRSAGVRRPPRPPHQGESGRCCMCGTTDLPARRRTWCSDACVDTWLWATMPAVATAMLIEIHGDHCWTCDTAAVLELEHVRPLWSLTDQERAELRWWLPYNLQLLCVPCHRAKTSMEAGWRAAFARGETPAVPWA